MHSVNSWLKQAGSEGCPREGCKEVISRQTGCGSPGIGKIDSETVTGMDSAASAKAVGPAKGAHGHVVVPGDLPEGVSGPDRVDDGIRFDRTAFAGACCVSRRGTAG